MWNKTIASEVLRLLGAERRRVFGGWRVLILCRRIAGREGAELPEWEKSEAVVRELVRRGDAVGIEGVGGVYRVEAPYAEVVPVSDEQIVQEGHPWAVFSGLTALVYHGLTNQIPRAVYATDYGGGTGGRVALGTQPEEWMEVELPRPRLPARVGAVPVVWWRTKAEWDFGQVVGQSQGQAIYVTDLERTLVDVVRAPENALGIGVALGAWREGRERVAVERLTAYTERLESAVLRQRVGYLLDMLGLANPRREAWRGRLQRGGTMKMVGHEAYSPIYSEAWNLSLNVPESVLAALKG